MTDASREMIRVIGRAKLGAWTPDDDARIATLEQLALLQLATRLSTAASADAARAVLATLS